jgi:hypothetical protein
MVAFSSAIIQQAMEIFRIDMRLALWSRWLMTVAGSYPGSKGLVSAGSSGTPISLK